MREELRVSETFSPATIVPVRATPATHRSVWNDSFGIDDLEKIHAEAERAQTPVSSTCTSVLRKLVPLLRLQRHHPKRQECAPPYLDVLKKEIDRVSLAVSRSRPVVQFMGRWHSDLSHARQSKTSSPSRANASLSHPMRTRHRSRPRVTNRAHLEVLRKLGFNRLSMGVQDFHPEVQKTIHRIQPYELTRDLIIGARELASTASTWT